MNMENNTELYSVIIYTRAGKGYGYGHLKRSISLYNKLIEKYQVSIIIYEYKSAKAILESKKIKYYSINSSTQLKKVLTSRRPNLLITDIRDTSLEITKWMRKYTKILSIDDYGLGSHYANVTIHMLAKPSQLSLTANFTGQKYLVLPDDLITYKKKKSVHEIKNVLISFGGEDPYGLSKQTISLINKLTGEYNITIILGPLYQGTKDLPVAKIIDFPDNIYPYIEESDILITSYGLTVYESLMIGTPVITINPTEYHNDLAQQVIGINNLGVYSAQHENDIFIGLKSCLESIQHNAPDSNITTEGTNNVSQIIDNLIERDDELCPICQSPGYVFQRDEWFNQTYCYHCYTFFRIKDYHYHETYSDDYFTTQYQNQYGKTYIEDKFNINRLNTLRINIIQKLSPPKSDKKLLELGSAMGFFLEMASLNSYQVEGVEISKYAVDYSKSQLGLTVTQSDANDFDLKENYYDIISGWYFIEHQQDFLSLLRKIHSSLKKGGLIALSTPNVHGISFIGDPQKYIQNIPKDHYIEFSPKSLNKLLHQEGFIVKHLAIRGIHLNRIRNVYYFPRIKVVEKIVLWISKILKLGDTFEIYAIKN